VRFEIDSSVARVTIYRSVNTLALGGSWDVYVDGVLTTTIPNNTAIGIQYGVPYTFSVTPGNHTIELRNTSSRSVDIDQIMLSGAMPALGVGTYQETESSLLYEGSWTSSPNSAMLSGAHRYTNDPNGRVLFHTDSSVSRVMIYRTIYNASVYGSWNVYVDGVLTASILNNTSSTFQFSVPFTINLTPGEHTIELRNASNRYSDLDQIVLLGPIPALGIGMYQESHAALAYEGNWTANANANVLGGTHRYTNDPNASVRFRVDSTVTNVTIYRSVYSVSVGGTWDLYVDGEFRATIPNNTSPSTHYGSMFQFGLVPGEHTIELRNTSNRYSDLDQIVLRGPIVPLGIGLYQDSDESLNYSGLWTTNANASVLGGTHRYTNDPNASVGFPINNTVSRIVIYRSVYTASVGGVFKVYVDGELAATIPNNTAASTQYGVPFTFDVTPGNHTVVVQNSVGLYSDIDQIVLLGPPQPLGIGTYQESDPALTYAGSWTTNASPSVLGGAHRYTNDANANFSFQINDTVGQIVFYRTTFPANVGGSWNVYIDNNLVATIPNNFGTGTQYRVPFTVNVTPGNHTVQLRHTSNNYSDIDQIVLLGPPQPLGIGTYQESEGSVTYTGSWTTNASPSVLGGTHRFTNDANARVSFVINSSVERVTIYRTIFPVGVGGAWQIYVNGVAMMSIPNNTAASNQYGVPFTFEVTPGNQTVELRNSSGLYSDIDQIVLMGAPEPLGTGTYAENDPALSYTGNWVTSVNSGMLGGAHRYTNDPNATLSFDVDSSVSRVVIYRTIYNSSVYGTWGVYVNGNLAGTIANNTSATFLLSVPYTINLTPGNNRIELRNTSNKYSDIDQIVLLGPVQPLGTGTYPESDAALTYAGTWTHNASPSVLGGTHRFTNDPNARVSFAINSSVERVVIYRTIFPASVGGTWQVYVDDQLAASIPNNTAASNQYGVPFTVNVTPGNHTIELRNTSNRYSDLDQIALLGPVEPLTTTPGTYQESDPALVYTGTWTANTSPSVLGGTHRFTNDPNARVSFAINNSVGRVVIYRTIYTAGVGGTWQIYVDGVLAASIPNNTASGSYQFGAAYTLNVTPGNHVIELRNSSGAYSDLDQIVLLPPA